MVFWVLDTSPRHGGMVDIGLHKYIYCRDEVRELYDQEIEMLATRPGSHL